MRTVFLTGATGTIGSALVPRLLAEPSTTVRLLVRAADDGQLKARLAAMLDYWGFKPGDPCARRIAMLRGDISAPNLGLSDGEHAAIAAECSHLIHCAASVNLLMPLDQARATAVAPTRAILQLGRMGASAGVLRKIDLVSTVGVWGRTPGRMPERRLPEVDSFHNTYEAAKAEAERVIWLEGQSLPISVHRPSMVVGETSTGRVIHFQIFYHLCEFLSGMRTYGVIPSLGDTRLDLIPVDWVASAIDWSSRHPAETAGAIYHLCSGPEGAIELTRLQQQVRMVWEAGRRPLPPIRRVPRGVLQALVPLIGAVAGPKTRRALRALPPVLAYLAERQSFGNEQTARFFAAAGLPVPQISDYLGPVLQYYLKDRMSRGNQ
ncbi:UDP-glucose 4-epimerase [Rubrivivax gelatinosus]|nr:UDP-glucose 4-epimerase [Rubrivivax gelatinosus]